MTRLDELRTMRDFLDREIAAEQERLGQRSAQTEALIARVCTLYSADIDMVLQGRRDHTTARARHAAAWLLRRRGLSLPKIGAVLGVDHTSALYACRKIDGSPAIQALLLGLEAAA